MAESSMSTSDTALQELMQYDADVRLIFDDGELPAKSYLLGLHSSVLKGAVEAATAGAVESSSERSSRVTTIPMTDIKKDDWLQFVPFLYPVVPPPVISNWTQLEVLLKVASRFDMKQLLYSADVYLTARSGELVPALNTELCVWKWLRLADKSGLQQCLPVLIDRVVAMDRAACQTLSNLEGLSLQVVQLLVVSCATNPPGLAVGGTRMARCNQCAPNFFAAAPLNPAFGAAPAAAFGAPAGAAAALNGAFGGRQLVLSRPAKPSAGFAASATVKLEWLGSPPASGWA